MFVYKKVCIVVEKKIVKVKKHVGNYGELKNKKKKVGLKKKYGGERRLNFFRVRIQEGKTMLVFFSSGRDAVHRVCRLKRVTESCSL